MRHKKREIPKDGSLDLKFGFFTYSLKTISLHSLKNERF